MDEDSYQDDFSETLAQAEEMGLSEPPAKDAADKEP